MVRATRSNIATSAPKARAMTTTVLSDAMVPSSPRSPRNTTNSDDSDGLVTRQSSGPNRRGIAKIDARMSGAMAPEDVGPTRLRPPTGRQRAALSRIAREADHAKAIEALKRRRDEALAKERGEQIVIPSSMPEADSRVTEVTSAAKEHVEMAHNEKTKPVSVARMQATPVAESSLLALAKFKRRPGQLSFQQAERQIELPQETFFREELEEFQPNDESTPFHVSTLQPLNQRRPASHATSSSPDSLVGNRSRKRKLTPPQVQIPSSQSPVAHISSPTLEPIAKSGPNTYDIPASEEEASEPELPPARLGHAPTPEIWSDTMAPPQSSSPTREDHRSARFSRINKSKSKDAPMLSSTRKQSPRRPRIKSHPKRSEMSEKQPKSQPLKPMKTANLQNLLPRRKRRQRRPSNEFDLSGSSDAGIDILRSDEDRDELSLALPAVRKRKEKTAGKSKSGKGVNIGLATITQAKSNPPQKGFAKAGNTRKTKAKLVAKEPKKTYSRRVSDKENTSLLLTTSDHLNLNTRSHPDSDNSDHLPTNDTSVSADEPTPGERKVTQELQTLARKFREVDQWALEFEEVTASSSSPRDAR